MSKYCQSCAMPLKKVEDRGTEKNRQRSTKYCKYCYQDGEFVQKDFTVEDMKELVKEKMMEMGFPKFLASLYVRKIHRLERWK